MCVFFGCVMLCAVYLCMCVRSYVHKRPLCIHVCICDFACDVVCDFVCDGVRDFECAIVRVPYDRESRAVELSQMDMNANPAALQEWLTLQEIRTALGML